MFKHSKIIFRWLAQDEWQEWICTDMKAILELLSEQGISIFMVGEENYKSPAGVIFTDKPFSPSLLISKLPSKTALNIKIFENGVMCVPHYVSIAYEEGLGTNL